MRGPRSEGFLLVDKPAGMTSHDVVAAVRRALGERRIGHAGTLDPFATGLLVLLLGRATRLLPYVDGEPKTYQATIRFGAETVTDDVTGAVTRTAPAPGDAAIREAVDRLSGALDQVPPAYSAKKVGGKRAYVAARAGEAVALAPARVTVFAWQLGERRGDDLDATITCSGGTYVRALARDLGQLAGSAAHLASLRRTASGSFHLRDALPLARVVEDPPTPRPALEALASLAVEELDAPAVARVARGIAVPALTDGHRAALVDPERRLVAVAERDGALWRPRVVLADA